MADESVTRNSSLLVPTVNGRKFSIYWQDWPAARLDEQVVLTIVKSRPTAVFLIVRFDPVPLNSVTVLAGDV